MALSLLHLYHSIWKFYVWSLSSVAQLVGALSCSWRVVGLIPGQGKYLIFVFEPLSTCITFLVQALWEATNWCFSHRCSSLSKNEKKMSSGEDKTIFFKFCVWDLYLSRLVYATAIPSLPAHFLTTLFWENSSQNGFHFLEIEGKINYKGSRWPILKLLEINEREVQFYCLQILLLSAQENEGYWRKHISNTDSGL